MQVSTMIPILAALISAFAGAWAGAIVTLSRFKKEKAFEKRLDWYSRMIVCLHETAIELACAKQYSWDHLDHHPGAAYIPSIIWERVQLKHLEVNKLTGEGVIYARQGSYEVLWNDTGELQGLANATSAFNAITKEHLQKVRPTIDKLREASNVLAEDMRRQLNLDPLGVHPRDKKNKMSIVNFSMSVWKI